MYQSRPAEGARVTFTCYMCAYIEGILGDTRAGRKLRMSKPTRKRCFDVTHMIRTDVAMSEAVKNPLWQSAFFLCLWCISPPQFSQHRHTQKHVPMMGMTTRSRTPTVVHMRNPTS